MTDKTSKIEFKDPNGNKITVVITEKVIGKGAFWQVFYAYQKDNQN